MSEVKQFVDNNLEDIRECLRESYDIISFEVANNLQENVEEAESEGALVFPGYEDCVVGVSMDGRRVIYAMEFCVKKLQDDNDWDWEEAQEYFDFNILNTKVGSKDPIFI